MPVFLVPVATMKICFMVWVLRTVRTVRVRRTPGYGLRLPLGSTVPVSRAVVVVHGYESDSYRLRSGR